jgi:uncharacterized protein (DUF58 family)
MRKKLRSLYLTNRFFQGLILLIILFLISYFVPVLLIPAQTLFLLFSGLFITDMVLLYATKKGLMAHRFTPEKLSNGDLNDIRIYVEGAYPFPVKLRIIDEIPHQFQRRDVRFETHVPVKEVRVLDYTLRPVKRGEYSFGRIHMYVSTVLGLASRRYSFEDEKMVPVYPSFLQMRQYEMMAISNNLINQGVKKIRRIGHNMEFEQIKEYVPGDDIRTINWKATARTSQLMVNNYQDEKSQQVYSLIDKSRVMQMPFNGMTLLDYAINASLVISNIAIRKDDKAGLITFQDKVSNVIPASKRNKQMNLIMEALYKEKTAFRESDFSRLYVTLTRKLHQRSLLLLFTNFETLSGLERQMPYLRRMAKSHLLVVIFFENTQIREVLKDHPKKVRAIYDKAIAEKLVYEKHLIVKELRQQGIHTILTAPENLTVNTINKYLELKARGLI